MVGCGGCGGCGGWRRLAEGVQAAEAAEAVGGWRRLAEGVVAMGAVAMGEVAVGVAVALTLVLHAGCAQLLGRREQRGSDQPTVCVRHPPPLHSRQLALQRAPRILRTW